MGQYQLDLEVVKGLRLKNLGRKFNVKLFGPNRSFLKKEIDCRKLHMSEVLNVQLNLRGLTILLKSDECQKIRW